MDMDIDWCLTCNSRVYGNELYCSLECQFGAGPSTSSPLRSSDSRNRDYSSSFDNRQEEEDEYGEEADCYYEHEDEILRDDLYFELPPVPTPRWTGRGDAGIRAWAADIPFGAPPNSPPRSATPSDDAISITSSNSSAHRAPNLVRPSRPVPPSLTMSKPELSFNTTTPRPILSLEKQLKALNVSHSSETTSRTSLPSDEDSLATPASTAAMPFSSFLGQPFPSISDARANEIAACTAATPSASSARHVPVIRDNDLFPQCDGKFAVPRIASPSSLQKDGMYPPPWWASNTLTSRQATKTTHRKPCNSVRKAVMAPSSVVRGRRSTRAAA